MAKHRADEPTPDRILDVEVVPIEPEPAPPAAPVSHRLADTAYPPDTGYTPDGVPTFESVRERIETRYGTSVGAAELAAETPEGRSVEEQYDARQRAATDRLAQIRSSMHDDQGQH